MVDVYDVPLPAIFLGGLALIWGVSELGWRVATRRSGQSTNINTLEGAMIGLLALLIGFIFSMALSRFEARRSAVLQEANAISTTELRARFLPDPYRAETLKLLRDYTQARLDAFQTGYSSAEFKTIVERSDTIQDALWEQARAISEKDKALIPTGHFIQSLNQMVESQRARLAALRNRIPTVVLTALYMLAAAAGGFVGYACALDPRLTRLPVAIMGLLISLVLYLIIDLDRPNSGLITNDQQPMIDVAASIRAFAD